MSAFVLSASDDSPLVGKKAFDQAIPEVAESVCGTETGETACASKF
jgi:hypothetical protein